MQVEALVSIIVPVYGTEEYLPACVESIRNQSYSPIEIILVDDQSPDRCPQICEEYAEQDPRVRVIHQPNAGVSGARNTGLRSAVGAYVMFVDSDDELYPDAVAILMDDLIRSGANVASGKKDPVDKHGTTLRSYKDDKRRVSRGEEALRLSLNGDVNMNSVCAKLFEREFIDGIWFSEGKNIHEDGFFLFQCFLRQPVLVQHDISVYRYKYREGSGSREGFSDKYLSMLYFCEEKKRLVTERYPQLTEQTRNMEVRINLQLLDLLCGTADPKYRALQKQCVRTVRALYRFHRPINRHHRQLAWIARCGLFPIYRALLRLKYYH